MNVKSALLAAVLSTEDNDTLQGLIADRFFPLGDPRGAYPRATYQRFMADRGETLEGQTGLVVAWFMLDAWSYVSAEADSIVAALQALLLAADEAKELGGESIRWIRFDGDRDEFERPSDGSNKGVYRAGFDARICYCERS